VWFTPEEWQTREKCAECEALENQKQERLIGTVKVLPSGKTVFTHQLTGIKYNLIPCDLNCTEKEVSSFEKIGVVDYANQQLIYFDIEGKIIPEKDEFRYSFIIVLDSREFVNLQETKGLTFDEIRDKYTAVNEETFPLNENYGEFRGALDAHFTEEQRQQPIPIKEATWETSDSTLLTIWFIEKQNKWTPIEQYEWNKGTEF
jgi:hypothetical protein